ncbi:MAG: hypothetical protein ACI4SS_02235, partial [Clostridia bacterium]
IGSAATDATPQTTTQPFGFGAFLLAGSEVSRWVGGVTEGNEPYLQRKMWGSVAVKGNKYYVNGQVVEGAESFVQDGQLYVPAEEFAGYMGYTVTDSGSGLEIKDEVNGGGGILMGASVVEKDGVKYASVSSIAKLMGKYIVSYGDVTVVSHKSNVFYDCDENAVKYLSELLN